MKIFFTLLTFLGLSLSVFSQPCSGGFESIATDLNFGSGGAIVLATAATSSQTVANVAAGEYVRVYVCAGTSYTFSTCTSVSLLNSEISINDDTGTDAFGQYDDDGCGDVGGHASLTWVATVTGIVQVLVTENTALGGACDTNPAALFDLTITSATPCGPDGASCDFPIIVNADSYASGLSSTCDFGNAYDDSMIGCPGENFYLNGNDVVYTFTPSTTQSYEFSLLNPDVVSMGYFVFDACPDAGGNCLINDGSGIGDALAQDVNLTAGTTYYVVVSSNPADATNGVECGNYELNIIPSPPGKTCDAPFVIPTASFSQTGFTTCGFGDDYDTAPGCDIDDNFIGGDDFVMEYTASVSGCYDINLTNGDSFLGLFVSTTCPPTNCDAYAESGNTPSLQTNVYLEAGQTYYFTISTEPAPQCSPFDFSITECTADGEDCNTPAVISSGATAGLTTCGMGDNYSDADACGSTFMNGEEAIYNFTVPADGCYDISFANVSNTAADFGAFVLDGCPDAGATCIAQGGQSAGTPTVTANLTAGITYTLVVATSDCANFDLNIDNVTCPVGVNCANPQGVTIGANGPFDMTASGDDYDNGDGCGSIYLGGNDYVMTFTPTATDCYNFTTSSGTGFNPDTDLGLFILSDCPDAIGVQCIAQNEVDNGFPMADAYLNASQTYYIIIGAIEQDTPLPGFFSNSETIFNINISGGGTSCPPGANCSNPEIVNTGTNGPFDGCGAGNDYDSSVGCNNFYMNGEDFVMTFTPSATDCYDIIVNGTANSNPDADVGLFVLTDCPDIATECVIEETAANGFPMGTAVLQAGQIYYVVVSAIEIITPLTENSSCTEFTLDINAGSVNCPVGETCANPLVIPSLGTYSGLTSCGSGDDYDNTQAANCSTGVDHYLNGEDFVMTFTPSSSGCHNFQFSNPTDPDADSGVFIYDGCPDANPNCVGFGVDENGVPDNVLTDLTAGTTYYVVFSAVELTGAPGTGLVMPSCNGFDMEVSTCDPPQPIQDCIGAIPVCQGTYVYNDGFLGDGNNPNEAPNGSCLLDNELNSIWFVITADSDGDFSFLITPMNGTDDYDFGVYDITTGGCAGIGSGASPQLSCSYAQSPGATGAGPIPGLNDQDATGTLINGAIPVTTGQTLALLISNFSGSSTGFTLDLTLSTADVFDESPPTIASITDPVTCGATTFDVELSEPIDCSTFAPCDFNVVFPDGSNHALTDVTAGSGCAAGNPFEQNFTFTVDAPMDQDGTYTLEIGNGCSGISDNCGNIQTNTSITFDVMGITCMIVSQMDETCTNGMGSLEVSASDGTTYTYTLDGGMSQTTGLYTGLSAGMYTVVATDDITGCTCSEMITIADVGTPPTINNVMTMDANCGNADGEVTFEINGGTPPYTVTVGADTQMGNDPFTFTGISSGTGSIDVTDDTGCTASTTFIINDAGGPTIDSVVPADATCGNDDGSAVVTISGGSPDYTVTIDGVTVTGASPVTVTGLSVGTHSVDVADANGCMTSGSVTIDEADSPMIDSAVPTNSTCGNADGQIVVTVSGGMANYTVDIGGGITQTDAGPTFTFTGLAASTYNITVTDMNGCTATGSATIMDAGGPTIDSVVPADATCGNDDGSAVVTISGGSPDYTVTIDGVTVTGASPVTVTGLSVGTHSVDVADANGCMTSGSVTIDEADSPMIDSAVPTNSTCGNADGQIVVTVSGGMANYTVDIGGGITQTDAGPTFTFTGLAASTYNITVTDMNGCTATGSATIMDAGGPMIDMITPTDATCGMNNGSVEVVISGGVIDYSLTVNGVTVSGSSPLIISGLPMGTYPVEVEDMNGCMVTGSVTINDSGAPTIDMTTPTNSTCGNSDGSVEVTISGGTAPYTVDLGGGNMAMGASPVTVTGLMANAYTITVTDAAGCTATGNVTIMDAGGPMIDTVTPTDATCGAADGSVEVAISSGTAPYTLTVNMMDVSGASPLTINGLMAGTYPVTIEDANGCMATSSVTIDDAGSPMIDNVVSVDANCMMSNGSLTINVSGGVTPYTYDVNSNIQNGNNVYTNLPAGAYTILVTDANGCSVTGNATINDIPGIAIDDVAITDANCGQNDGSITVSVSGGPAPINFNFNNINQTDNGTFNGVAAGNYILTVTDDNSCTATQNVTIDDVGGITLDDIVIVDAACGIDDGTATINITGGSTPITYTLNGINQIDNNVFTDLAEGNYNVTITDDNGCTATGTTTIGGSEAPVIDNIMTVDANCGQADGSATINATGGTPPYSYSLDGTIQNDPNNQYTSLASGNYDVIVTDANGCTVMGTASINDAGGATIDGVDITDATCGMPTGQFTVNVSGGMPPYMITANGVTQTDPLFTGLMSGIYPISVVDASGCETTTSATVGNIPGVQIDDIMTTDASCGQADGSKTIIVSGGNAPYTFECNGIIQVDNGVFTGMIAGNYVVTVTDNDGCTATGSATINDADGPTIDNVVEGDANCGMPNGTLTINANPTDGLPPFMYTVGMTTQANNIFTGLLAGTYNPIVTDANGCTATLSATIDDISGVQIDDITTIDATCGQADGSKTIVVSGGTAPYTFECNGTIQVDNGTFTGLMAGSYPVTVTDANGCTATGNASINDADGPTIDSAIATDANCGMSNGTITVTISGGATPYNVTVNGETLQTTETIIFDDLPAGDYGIEVVDANGCGASSSAEIIDISGVMLNDIIVLDASCGQADGSKNIMVSGGNAPYTFTCGALTQTDNGLFENLPAGVYPWTVTDADGCMIDGTTTINDANGPSIDNVTVTDATNGNNDGSIAITISGGLPPYTVNVNATDMTTNDMVTFNGIGAGTYPVTVTDANGCTATGTATVNEGGCPVIDDIIVMNATCGNADGTITIEASGGATPLMYSIDGGVTFENNNIFNNLLADDYNIVIQDAAGCQVTGLATIMNLGAPSITDISTMDANCGQADGSITITAMGGTGGLMYSNDGGMNFQASNVFSNLPAGNYDIVVQDALGCEIADLASIQNLDAPVINDIMTTDVNCGNDDGSITINAMGGAAPLTYLVNGMPSVDNNNVFNNMSAGNYDIQVIDDNGCEVNATAEIMDDGAPIITNVNTTNASCGNADGTITISANGGLAPLMYSIDDGVTFQAGNIFNVSGGNYDPIVSDANGCTETNPTVTVNEDDAPIIDNIMEVDATCGNMDGSVTITVSGGVAPYTFDINGNIMTDPATATFTGLGAGIYTINIMDANGCTVIGSATIDDLNGPMIDNVSVMDATNGNADGSFTVTATGGTPPYTFEANGQMMNDASMATFTGLAAGNYPFTITDANGCMAASSATINEGECPTIDDITTTNADCGMATGTITVTATGGVAPLLYQLDNGTASANNVFTGVTGGMHTITVTDAAGCMISEMVTVDENGGATIDDVTVTGSTCDENNGTAVVTVSGGMMPYSYTINGIQQAENTFDNLQPGNYTVTVTDANDCEAMQMFTINDLAAPVVDDVVVLNASCGNTDGGITILATGGNGTLMYSIDGGMNFQVSNIFTGLAAGGYDYAVMDDNCTVTGVVAVSNDGAPEITSIDATDASCGTADGTLTVNTMGGTPPLTYTVNMIDQVDDNVFTGLPAGDYTVVVEDANGCVGSTVATIIESGTLTVNILGNLTICDGTTTLLTADPANAGYDFEWSTGSLTNETAVSTAGTVTLVATLGNCIGMTSVEVVVADLPTANAGADVTLDCDNPTAMLDGSGSMGNNLTYNWTTMDGTIVGANDISTIEINSGGTYILEVTEDIAGCTDLDTVIVTQNAVMPTADAGADMEITCLIQAVTLDGSGSSANVNYSWTGPGITAANMNQQSPQVTQAGDYVLTVTNITSNCTATDMVTVTEDVDMPIADIAVVVPIDCSNTTLDIDGSNSSAGPEFTYQWLDENMNPIAGEINSILTVDSEGIYTLQVTNTTNGCVSSETVIVDDLTVFPLTVAQVSGVLTCDVLEVDLDGSGSQTGATIIYEWVDAAGNLVGNNLVETVSEIGFYTLTITDTDSECFNEITIEVTQNLTAPEAVAGSDIALDCLDPTVILDGSESDQGPNFTYFWNADNGQTINGETTLTPTVSESGIYRIVVTDSENGCTSENFVVVSENVETPTGMGLSFDLPDCEGDENGLIFVDSIQGGIGPFVYAIDGGGFSASPIFNSLTAGDYEITVQSPGGCTYSEVATLEDGYDLMVDLGEDIFINLGDEADIEAVVNIGPLAIDTIIWEANDTLCINCYEQTVTPMMTMNYNVQVVDENGCIADDDLTIFVNQNVDLFMPNIFSPNGDNRNQFFYPQAVEGVIQNISSIEIFNRWGDLVFETSDIMPNDPEAGWDGTFNGRTLSPQVFVYRIEAEFINGNTKVFSGDVTLVK